MLHPLLRYDSEIDFVCVWFELCRLQGLITRSGRSSIRKSIGNVHVNAKRRFWVLSSKVQIFTISDLFNFIEKGFLFVDCRRRIGLNLSVGFYFSDSVYDQSFDFYFFFVCFWQLKVLLCKELL